jgi:hypothetical protein
LEEANILKIKGIHQKAKAWENEGFKVEANIGGWDRPSLVEGLMPDIRGKKDDHIRLGFVDFDDKQEENQKMMSKLLEKIKTNTNFSLRFYNISEGECKLLKIEK